VSPIALVLLAAAWMGLARVRLGAPSRSIAAVVPAAGAAAPSITASTASTSAIAGPPAESADLARRRVRRSWLVPVGSAIVVTAVLGPLVGGLALAAPIVRRRRAQGRDQRREAAAVVDQVPEVIDLLTLALGAGLNVSDAVAAVARWAPGPVGDALAAAHRAVERGEAVAVALESARDRCGPAATGLFGALIAADRYGTPLLVALDRLGQDARLDRRRAAEERARRVPVQLLFPLVVCVLPAFGLLTVVPLLVNSLGTLT